MIIFLALVFSIFGSLFTMYLASEKGYSKTIGFIAGYTWIGLFVFLLLPRKDVITYDKQKYKGTNESVKVCVNCKKRIPITSSICPSCGIDLT